jgi:hypothetical protein
VLAAQSFLLSWVLPFIFPFSYVLSLVCPKSSLTVLVFMFYDGDVKCVLLESGYCYFVKYTFVRALRNEEQQVVLNVFK